MKLILLSELVNIFKGPFYDPIMPFLWQFSRQNKLISTFSVDSECAFVRCACFTMSYCCIGHFVGNYYVDIMKRQLDRLFCQTNEFARNILHTHIVYLKASADFFFFLLRKMWGWGWDFGSRNGPLIVCLVINYVVWSTVFPF